MVGLSIHWWIDWLIDWSIHCSIACLIDWLIDWLIYAFRFSILCFFINLLLIRFLRRDFWRMIGSNRSARRSWPVSWTMRTAEWWTKSRGFSASPEKCRTLFTFMKSWFLVFWSTSKIGRYCRCPLGSSISCRLFCERPVRTELRLLWWRFLIECSSPMKVRAQFIYFWGSFFHAGIISVSMLVFLVYHFVEFPILILRSAFCVLFFLMFFSCKLYRLHFHFLLISFFIVIKFFSLIVWFYYCVNCTFFKSFLILVWQRGLTCPRWKCTSTSLPHTWRALRLPMKQRNCIILCCIRRSEKRFTQPPPKESVDTRTLRCSKASVAFIAGSFPDWTTSNFVLFFGVIKHLACTDAWALTFVLFDFIFRTFKALLAALDEMYLKGDTSYRNFTGSASNLGDKLLPSAFKPLEVRSLIHTRQMKNNSINQLELYFPFFPHRNPTSRCIPGAFRSWHPSCAPRRKIFSTPMTRGKRKCKNSWKPAASVPMNSLPCLPRSASEGSLTE